MHRASLNLLHFKNFNFNLIGLLSGGTQRHNPASVYQKFLYTWLAKRIMLDYCGLAKTVSKTLQNMIEVYPIDAYLYFIMKTF